MSNVKIEVFNIARTMVDPDEVRRWLDRMGAHEFSDDPDDHGISDPAYLIAIAAKRCYLSFEVGLNPNITRVRSDYVSYFDNVLRSGHGSVLEHAVYSYAFEGVSRVFTAEMNRHRAGWAISEGSLRFIPFQDDIPWWLPNSIAPGGGDADLEQRKAITRQIFNHVFDFVQSRYADALRVWDAIDESDKNFAYRKKITSMLRRMVPLGVATGGVWTGNIRALRHVIALRTDPAAEEEIAHVFGLVAEDIIRREPILFMDFRRNDAGAYVSDYRKV